MFWKRLLCRFSGHTEEALSEKRHEVTRLPWDVPDPVPGHVLVETFSTLYQIDAIVFRQLQCVRCGHTRVEQDSIREKPPLRLSRWLAIPTEGRILLPNGSMVDPHAGSK